MKHPRGGPPTGRRRAGPPPPGRRSPSLWHVLRPQSTRTLVLGGLMSVSGFVGGARGWLDGMETGTVLKLLGLGNSSAWACSGSLSSSGGS
ncbi:hypothetical protein [Streptomyces parvus]|uniref:hypothetical protein n=1 Tax=Streptomyces parvus TaxID=66428 RepID=UPI0035DA48F2